MKIINSDGIRKPNNIMLTTFSVSSISLIFLLSLFTFNAYAAIPPEIIISSTVIEDKIVSNRDLIINENVTVTITGTLTVKGLETFSDCYPDCPGPTNGNLINYGTIENSGLLVVNTEFVNYGTLNNLGTIEIACDASFRNEGELLGSPIFVCGKPYDAPCSPYDAVALDYLISAGHVTKMCLDKDSPAITMAIQSDTDGTLQIKIPKKLVYSVNQDCESQNLIVLIDDSEIVPLVNPSPLDRDVSVDFASGTHVIEFIGSYTLGDDVHQYCGEIYGHTSKFLPPKLQHSMGRSSDQIKCNDGLELTAKRDGMPACVKPESISKLSSRNWILH